MTTEEKLKEFILSKYKSVLEFTQSINMPYGTIASIFRRGIGNSSVTNIIKICQALGISADELAEGNIVSVSKIIETPQKVEDIISNAKQELINGTHLTLNDEELTETDVANMVLSLDMIIEIEKQRKSQLKRMK